jgi:hypothetical protein
MISGDGKFSFDEFVEIVSNMGDQGMAEATTKDQEEKELRDAFRVSLTFHYHIIKNSIFIYI